MTLRAISGLILFNLFVLGAGAGVLWGLRGWRSWTEFVRLGGVAFLLGFASLMIVFTYEIVLGIPINLATTVLSGLGLVAAGLAVGEVRGHSWPALRPAGWRFPGLSLFAALFVAGIVVYFEGLFRADRLAGIVKEWDGWAFWMPKAEGIYFLGRLEPAFLSLMPGPSYPPGLPSIHAAAFHAMGSADTVTIHLQYWFFAVGFVAAVVGLLAPRVQQAILFPLLLVVLVAPSLVERMATTYGDIPLGYLIAAAALLVVLWLDEQKSWQLLAATLLLAGAMLTKREGMIFAACVLLPAFVASWRDRRQLWSRLALAGLVAFALALPWRVWFTARGLPGDGPETGYLGSFSHLERVWPSLKLVVTTLFDQDLWPLVAMLAAAAIALAAIAHAWRITVYVAVFVVSAIAASTWVIWSNVSLRIVQDDAANPIVRMTGTTILALAVLTPLLLQWAWSGRTGERSSSLGVPPPWPDAFITRSTAAWAIVLVGVLSHPGAMLVGYSGSGLPGGAPRFPTVDDCVSPPTPGKRVRVVVGYADSYPEAVALRARAVAAGLTDTKVAQDGCGRLRVFVDEVAPGDAARLIAEASAARLDPSLESDPEN